MALGFSFRHTLSGSYFRLDAPTDERAIAVTLVSESADARAFTRRRSLRTMGRIEAERLATARQAIGTLAIDVTDKPRIAYRLQFGGDDGHDYELSGVEEWKKAAPLEVLTLLRASIYDVGGEEVARATLRFDVRADWAECVKSLRLLWR